MTGIAMNTAGPATTVTNPGVTNPGDTIPGDTIPGGTNPAVTIPAEIITVIGTIAIGTGITNPAATTGTMAAAGGNATSMPANGATATTTRTPTVTGHGMANGVAAAFEAVWTGCIKKGGRKPPFSVQRYTRWRYYSPAGSLCNWT